MNLIGGKQARCHISSWCLVDDIEISFGRHWCRMLKHNDTEKEAVQSKLVMPDYGLYYIGLLLGCEFVVGWHI